MGNVPDLLGDQKIYEWAGLGFGENESLLLMKSLKQLITTTQATNMRLWGKILGTQKDYYIVEGTYEGGQDEETEKPPEFEARGTGVNKYAYWATNSPLDAWTLLPDLYPKDIKAAREIKVHLTGDLNRSIITNPFFFGKEKHFLRAQIARISFSTSVAPARYYRLVEDTPREIEENQPDEGPIPIPSTLEMGKLSNWVHHTPNILNECRLVHMEREVPDGMDIDPEDYKKQFEAADPFEPRLKPLTEDKQVKGKLPAWTVRLCGDTSDFGNPNPALGKQNYGVAVLRSLQWPGSYAFFTQGRWLQLYVGDGLKHEA